MRCSWAGKPIVMVVGIVAFAAACAGVGTPAQDQPKPVAKEDLVHYSAKIWKRTSGDKPLVVLNGDVTFAHEDTTLKSDQVNYDEKTRIATSPGKVTITDPECDITGDKGSANFKKRLGEIVGNVVMLAKPKPVEPTPENKDSIRQKLTKPTTISCPKLEYLYKDKIATLTGPVSFKQEKRSATADKAVYDGKAEILTLTGSVKGIDEEGQTFTATTLKVSFKKGDEWMEAENGSASIKVDLGEENKSQVESPKSKVKSP